MTPPPSVTLIVLNWNTARYLPDCLNALLALDYPNYSITVVDNNSTDDSVALIERGFPTVNLIKNDENRGFSAGNNSGIRAATTPIVVLVNPDVELEPDALTHLVQPLLDDEQVGLAGGKLLYPNGEIQFLGGEITQPQGFPQHHTEMVGNTAVYIIGALMGVRREVFEAVGLFDEGYFLYYEDADFCERAKRAGFKIALAPDAVAIHHESAATDRRSDFYWEMMFLHRWRYLLKHQPAKRLLEETVAAEMAWVGQLGEGAKRRLLAQTYRRVLLDLPKTLAARVADGMEPLSDAETAVLQQSLVQLRTAALQPNGANLETLREKAFVQERPFVTRIPLLAWLQEQWINIAARWYVRPQTQQQNQFNLGAVQRLQEQAERLLAQSHAQTEYAEDIALLTVELQRMNEQLAAIHERLESMEKREERKE